MSHRALGIAAVLAGTAVMSGCGVFASSTPVTPKPRYEAAASLRKLPVAIHVIVDAALFSQVEYTQLNYTPKGHRLLGGDVTVRIGESSLELLELSLPGLFEEVQFSEWRFEGVGVSERGAEAERAPPRFGEGEIVLLPELDFYTADLHPTVWEPFSASIDYLFAFYQRRGSRLVPVEVLRVSGSGESARSTLFLDLGIGILAWLLPFSQVQLGTFEAAHYWAPAFAEAQLTAIEELVRQIQESEALWEVALSVSSAPESPTEGSESTDETPPR